MKSIQELDGVRYVGDRTSMTVHDSWNRDSEHCLLDELAESGNAVGFDPDTLEQSFWEGFDYCDDCFGKREPAAPYRSPNRRRKGEKSRSSTGLSLTG